LRQGSRDWVGMSKVLIVGGAGYVGGWMTDEAIHHGHEVRVVDNLTYEDSFLKRVDFAFGDILDFKTMEKHLQWADTVSPRLWEILLAR
jgi:nucleoside-diphosphate-sugar epimerase